MIRIGRKKRSDCLQLEALVLDVVLNPPAHDSLPGSQRRRRRRSTGMIAEAEATEIPAAPRQPLPSDSEPSSRRRGLQRQVKNVPRRSRIDKSHLQINRRGLCLPTNATASSAKINDLHQDSPGLTADLTPNDQVEDETLDMYFDVMKRRADFRRKLLDLNDPDLFDTTDQCAQTVLAPSGSVASGGMTVRTEPAIRPSKSRRKKPSKRESNWRNDDSSKLPRRVYAQIEFEQGSADVKFWKLRSSGNEEKTEQAGDESFGDNIQPHAKCIPSDQKRDFEQEDSSKAMTKQSLQKSKLAFKRFSSSAA